MLNHPQDKAELQAPASNAARTPIKEGRTQRGRIALAWLEWLFMTAR